MTVESARAIDEYTRRTQDPSRLPPEGYLRFVTFDGAGFLDVRIDDIEKLQLEADAAARERIGTENRPEVRFVFGALDSKTFAAVSGLVCEVQEGEAIQSCTEDPALTEQLRRR